MAFWKISSRWWRGWECGTVWRANCWYRSARPFLHYLRKEALMTHIILTVSGKGRSRSRVSMVWTTRLKLVVQGINWTSYAWVNESLRHNIVPRKVWLPIRCWKFHEKIDSNIFVSNGDAEIIVLFKLIESLVSRPQKLI
jgi:hypothetical protein